MPCSNTPSRPQPAPARGGNGKLSGTCDLFCPVLHVWCLPLYLNSLMISYFPPFPMLLSTCTVFAGKRWNFFISILWGLRRIGAWVLQSIITSPAADRDAGGLVTPAARTCPSSTPALFYSQLLHSLDSSTESFYLSLFTLFAICNFSGS